MNKLPFVSAAVFLFLAAPAFAVSETEDSNQTVQTLVLGVSPASVELNVTVGETARIKFLVSTNVDFDQNVTVGFIGSDWITSEKFITFINTHYLYANVSVPACEKEGTRSIRMVICRKPDPRLDEPVESASCLSPTITVNVRKNQTLGGIIGCSEWKYPAIAAIALAVTAILWQVSRIKRARKKKR